MTIDNVLPADPAGVTLTIEDEAANAVINADAREFGTHDGPASKWRLGLIVARNCEPGLGASSGDNQHEVRSDRYGPSGKVSLAEFARRANTTTSKVSRYYDQWEEHAAAGTVPRATDIAPGDDPPLPTDVKWKTSEASDEWYTPKWLFDALGLMFAIDVCSPADRAHVAVPTESWYTEEDDGLAQEWKGLCWCNPPYSDAEPWADKMIEHGDGLLLTHVPMNGEWMLDVWRACDAFRLFQGMDFVRPSGDLQRPAWWLCLAAFGPQSASALLQMEIPSDIEYRRHPTHLLPGGAQS